MAEQYRREVEPGSTWLGCKYIAKLYRLYPMYEGAEPRWYVVAFMPCKSREEANAYLDSEIAKGRLYMTNALGDVYAKRP